MSPVARLSLVDRADADLSIVAQCRLLKVARSTLYWRPAAVSEDDLRLMRQIDEQYLATPFYGVAADGGGAAPGWLDGEPQTRAAADAGDADRGDLPEAEHQPPSSGTQGLSLSFAGPGDRAAEPGVVRGHHLHPDGQGVRVSGRGDGLVQPAGAGVAGVDHAWTTAFCVEALQEAMDRHGAAGDLQDDRGMMHLRLSY